MSFRCRRGLWERFAQKGVPVLRSPERAMRALAHATAYGRRLARQRGAARAIEAPPLPQHGALAEHTAKAYLAALGIAMPAGGLAHDVGEARSIAARIGYPVVLKAQAAALAHKSDAGGVALNLNDAKALDAAWKDITQKIAVAQPTLRLDGMLVETMASRGVEMIVGARRDPAWGPVVLVGLGGIWT